MVVLDCLAASMACFWPDSASLILACLWIKSSRTPNLRTELETHFLQNWRKEKRWETRTESRAMCASWIMLSIALFTAVGLHKRLYLDLKSFRSSTCNASFQTSTCASANAFKILSSSQISLISRRSLVSGETSLKGFSFLSSPEGFSVLCLLHEFFSSCSPFLPSSR